MNLSLGKEKSHEPHVEHVSRSPVQMTQPEEFDLVILGGVGATRIPAARFRRFQYRRADSPQYLAEIWERSLRFGSAGQFLPGDQLNFLLTQNLPELVTREKIVVALPPGRAPCGAFPGGGP